jgi:flagellar basal body-associated protein FliL
MADKSGNDIDFVSQDEIDRLLSQADESPDAPAEVQEDAAAPEETGAETEAGITDSDASTDGETSTEASSEDIDDLLEQETLEEEAGVSASVDRVILEEMPAAPKEKKPRSKSIWPLHRDFWITLSVVFFMGTALNGLLWLYNKKSHKVIAPEVSFYPVIDTTVAKAPTTFRRSPRAITLKRFLVPAPVERKDLTYITADVSIELTHSKAVSLIKAHAPFYRNIIYDVIKRMLGALDKSKIGEISLKMEILKALNGSVPERSVRDVNVDTIVMF